MIIDPESLLRDFIKIAAISKLDFSADKIFHDCLLAPHDPPSLPSGKQAVYVFSLVKPQNIVLKVGKVGPKSNARFQSQHYDPSRAKSTLAASLLACSANLIFMKDFNLTEANVGPWIRHYTDRDHFFLDASCSKVTLSLLEVFLQSRLHPMFEG